VWRPPTVADSQGLRAQGSARHHSVGSWRSEARRPGIAEQIARRVTIRPGPVGPARPGQERSGRSKPALVSNRTSAGGTYSATTEMY
jgi:hypothetical protein